MTGKISPIVQAIAEAEKKTSGEIRVHLGRKFFEKNPLRSAQKVFLKFGLQNTQKRNAILLYVNLRQRKFAILGDEGIHQKVGQHYWDAIAAELKSQLHTTHYENAIAFAVRQMGEVLRKYFPVEEGNHNPDELSNEVTSD